MKKSTQLLFILLSLFFSSSIFAINIKSNNILAGGIVYSNQENEVPFALLGNDVMNTWQFTNKFSNFPKEMIRFTPSTMTCEGNICLMTGAYNLLTNKLANAFIAVSEDNGYHWDVKNVAPENSNFSGLQNIFCDRKQCVAIGQYQNRGEVQNKLLILTSDDHFATWQQIKNIPGYNLDVGYGQVASHCTDAHCLIVTNIHDFKNDTDQPVFLVANKDKSTWVKANSLPFVNPLVSFLSVSCGDTVCAAVGEYANNKYHAHALLYVSEDHGLTWLQKKLVDNDVGIDSIKCKDNYCIAIGATTKLTAVRRNVAIVSHDSGLSWQSIALPQPADTVSYFTKIDCTKLYCVTAGTAYTAPSTYSLFLYVSYDQGNTWKVIKDINNFPVVNAPAVVGLSCNEKNCLLIVDDIANKTPYQPIIIVSDETGNNWQTINNFIDLPDSSNSLTVRGVYHGNEASSGSHSIDKDSGESNQLNQKKRKV